MRLNANQRAERNRLRATMSLLRQSYPSLSDFELAILAADFLGGRSAAPQDAAKESADIAFSAPFDSGFRLVA